jgi:hypothetical protein
VGGLKGLLDSTSLADQRAELAAMLGITVAQSKADFNAVLDTIKNRGAQVVATLLAPANSPERRALNRSITDDTQRIKNEIKNLRRLFGGKK